MGYIMVSTVQNSLGASAYLKTSNAAPSGAQRREAQGVRETGETSAPRETERSTRSETRTTERPQPTQLESRNDESTLRTEQTRGNLLDLAV